MDDVFDKAFAFALDHEGRVFEDVAGDPGGPTKWGVTWIDANQWRKEHGLPALTITEARKTKLSYLTPEIIAAIYSQHYWQPLKAGQMPSPVGWVLFDAGVNCGNGRSVKWLQAELGVTVDGQVGPNTLAACLLYCQRHGASTLAAALITRRRDYYDDIGGEGKALRKFHKGWINRCGDLLAAIKPADKGVENP